MRRCAWGELDGEDRGLLVVEHVNRPDRPCMTNCATVIDMSRAVSVRLDDDADKALRSLEASGLTPSEAIRSALLDSARRLRRSKELAAEVAALEADPSDRAEMLAVADLMEALRAAR